MSICYILSAIIVFSIKIIDVFIRDTSINVIERNYGIKVFNLKYATTGNYIAYAYGCNGEIIGLMDVHSGFPYGIVEVQLLNDKYEVKEILGEELV